MLGTIVNTFAIVAGSLIGILFRGGVPKNYQETVIQAISLAILLIGLQGALRSDHILLVIFSMAIGSLLGEWLHIEARLEQVGGWLERCLARTGGNVAKGFITASLIYCVGSMAIVGSLESGLSGNHQTLFAKSVLDGIGSIIFASTLGIGVMFSAASVFIYQGIITLSASVMKQFLVPEVVNEMSAVGGLLIMAIGFNLLEFKRIKIGNMLPAVFIPLVYHIVKSAFWG